MATHLESFEDYLKEIYELSLDHSPVKTSQIAAALKVSPAAVTEMLKRLEAQRFVAYKPYRGATLTSLGTERALAVLRRHRLWEVFLFKILGIPWSQVHRHACRLEHGTDEQLADALDELLDHPRVDPHGDPIPAADGTMEEIDRTRLSSLDSGAKATVVQCANENPKLLNYLKSLGLVPGTRVELIDKAPFNGPLTLRIDQRSTAVLGVEAARTLIVQQESTSVMP